VLGVVVFGDVVHVTPLLLALQLAGIAAMVGGVILVARAPVFRHLQLPQLPQAAIELLHHPVLPLRHDGSGEPALDTAAPGSDGVGQPPGTP
jgi:hypothetical protein